MVRFFTIILITLFFSCNPAEEKYKMTVLSENDLPKATNLELKKYKAGGISVKEADYMLTAGDKLVVSMNNVDNPVVLFSLKDFTFVHSIKPHSGIWYFRSPPIFKKNSTEFYIFRENMLLDAVNSESFEVKHGEVKLSSLGKDTLRTLSHDLLLRDADSSLFTLSLTNYNISTSNITDPAKAHLSKTIFSYLPEFKGLNELAITSSFIFSQKHNRIVVAFKYLRRFDIIDAENGTIKRFEVKPNNNITKKTPTSQVLKLYYCGILELDDSFMLYYVGQSRNHIFKNPGQTTYFEEYSYDGTPLSRYSIAHSLITPKGLWTGDVVLCTTSDGRIIAWKADSEHPIWVMKLPCQTPV